MMTLHFCRSNNLGGWLIRLFTFSRWNHTAIEIDGTVYDATGRHGVQAWNRHDFASHWSRIESFPVKGDPVVVKRFLRAQLGKKYDWRAIIALPFRRNWQAEDRWFCSELSAAALNLWPAGALTARIKPQDLYLVIRSAYANH